MKKIFLLGLCFIFLWGYRTEIQDFWQKSELQDELAFLEDFNARDLEKTVTQLKAQLVDLQEHFSEKKDEGVEKVLEVKNALEETQQALQDLQQAVEDLQSSGKKVKEALGGE